MTCTGTPPAGGVLFFLGPAKAFKHMTRTTANLPRERVAISLIFLVCALVYVPGLFGGFVFDDFGSIVENAALRALDGSGFRWYVLALYSDAGILHRPISMLSFGIDYSLFGLNPIAYKATNLAIHLANGAMLYKLARRVVPRLISASPQTSGWIAFIATALWLLHPLNVGSVLYVVQRMNLLATLFTLAGLLSFVEGRERMSTGTRGLVLALGGLSAFAVLAVFSKENGALAFVYAFVIEAVCYRFAAPTSGRRRLLQAFFTLTIAVPVMLFLAYLALNPQWLVSGYAGRDFTLYERALTEARALCAYLGWIVVPLPRWMGIFHDDFVTSTGIFDPFTTVLALGLLAALLGTAWVMRQRAPAFTFAVAWFVAGHLMESTILPLELVFDHRNYLPMSGLLLGIVCLSVPTVSRWISARHVAALASMAIAVCTAVSISRVLDWSSELNLAMSEAAHHPQSARANYEAGRQIIYEGTVQGRRDVAEREAVAWFERAKELDPTGLHAAAGLIFIHSRQGLDATDAEVTDFARRVSEVRLVKITPYLGILSAVAEGNVRMSPEQFAALIDAGFKNERFGAPVRAAILGKYADYQFKIAKRPQDAVSLMVAASREDPTNPLFQINLANLAIALGEMDKAGVYLRTAEQLDKNGTWTASIAESRSQLSVH